MNKVKARDLSKKQKAAVRRMVRYFQDCNKYNKVTSVRYSLEATDYGSLWITLNTRRSDCHEYSPRAIFTREWVHAQIGKRGGIKIYTATRGIGEGNSFKKHLAVMLGCSKT